MEIKDDILKFEDWELGKLSLPEDIFLPEYEQSRYGPVIKYFVGEKTKIRISREFVEIFETY